MRGPVAEVEQGIRAEPMTALDDEASHGQQHLPRHLILNSQPPPGRSQAPP